MSEPNILNHLSDRLPPGTKPCRSENVERVYSLLVGGEGPRPNIRRFNLLFADVEKLARTMDLEEALDKFEQDLQLYIAEWTNRRVFVHAGVVGWRGKAIVIPGSSFSGKSTLVAELVKAGATYYSDEYAVVDSRGRIHPYAKPLALRENGSEKQTTYRPEHFGGVTGVKPLPVGLVVISKYRPGAVWRPRRLSIGQGALALLANTVSARTRTQLALDSLKEAVADATVVKSYRGNADAISHLLLEMIERKSQI